MHFLRSLLYEKSEDLSKLPEEDINAIYANIRKGAADLDQKWANALMLTHKAYEVEGIELPRPSMESAWSQYEKCLQYAVEQLAKHRGMKGELADWRMSSSIFHENSIPLKKFKVTIDTPQGKESYITEGFNSDEIIDKLEHSQHYDIITEHNGKDINVSFARFNVRKNIKVTISPL